MKGVVRRYVAENEVIVRFWRNHLDPKRSQQDKELTVRMPKGHKPCKANIQNLSSTPETQLLSSTLK